MKAFAILELLLPRAKGAKQRAPKAILQGKKSKVGELSRRTLLHRHARLRASTHWQHQSVI